MNINRLVRPNIVRLKPYRSARQDAFDGILLDANENAYGSPVSFSGLPLHRYPDPYQSKLRERLAGIHKFSAEQIFVGSGSDEVIDLLYRIFCEPGQDNVIIPEPTYGMYSVSAGIHNIEVQSSLLTDEFQLDVQDILSRVNRLTKMVFCCSPNNPTGNIFSQKDILHLCASTEALIVVDEAYIEFAGARSIMEYVNAYSNLIVIRTLSKSWGLAGIRIGYCIAHPGIIEYMQKVKAPYNVNSVSAALALRALDAIRERERIVEVIINEKKRLMGRLRSLNCVKRIYPSDANFFLIKVDNATVLYSKLRERGIIVRDRSSEAKLDNCIRITVGTPEENDALITALEEIDK